MCLKSWLQELWGLLCPPALQGARRRNEGRAGLGAAVSGVSCQTPSSWPAVQQAGAALGKPATRRGFEAERCAALDALRSTEVWGSHQTAARTVAAWPGCLCRALPPALAGGGQGASAAAGLMDSLGLMEQQLARAW